MESGDLPRGLDSKKKDTLRDRCLFQSSIVNFNSRSFAMSKLAVAAGKAIAAEAQYIPAGAGAVLKELYRSQ